MGRKLSREKWLEEGYSLEELATAIEHFRNSNFALHWLTTYLAKDSKALRTKKAALKRYTESEDIENPESIVNMYSPDYPSANLEGYKEMSDVKRREAINIARPVVDDLAAFIKSGELEDNDILELLNYVEVPNDVIASSGPNSPIFLFEFAIANKRYELARQFLERGVTPMKNGYLKNALELALRSLLLDLANPKKTQEHVGFIKLLSEKGFMARHHLQDDGSIKPWMPMLNYRFTNKNVTNLNQNYGLDLVALSLPIENQNLYKNDVLVEKMENNKREFISNYFDSFSYEDAHQRCSEIENDISTVWQPPSFRTMTEIRNLARSGNEELEAIYAELALRDPDFIDCVRDKKSNIEFANSRIVELLTQYYKRDKRQNKDGIIEFLTTTELSPEEQTVLFYDELKSIKTEGIKRFIELGISPNYLDYKQINWWKISDINLGYLDSNGFSTKTYDRHGKTMLYFAVAFQRADLIEFMLEQDYPFRSDAESQDPLHLLLASWKRRYSGNFVNEVLPMIMAFKPKIDNFHLARMELMKLQDKALFDIITQQYPELHPTKAAQYPEAACQQ